MPYRIMIRHPSHCHQAAIMPRLGINLTMIWHQWLDGVSLMLPRRAKNAIFAHQFNLVREQTFWQKITNF